jgi:hypothetical protein
MHKKIISICLLFVLILGCAGCGAAWRRKFVRKKGAEIENEPVLQPQDYRKEFTNQQFYANHYAFWRGSEAEFINCLKANGNQKRFQIYAAYTQKELEKLRELLSEEKKKELTPFIDELNDLITKINNQTYYNSNKHQLIRNLEKHYRAVSRGFSYYSMKGFILPDEEYDAKAE